MPQNGPVAEKRDALGDLPPFAEALRKRLVELELIPPLTRGAERLGITQGQLSKWLSGRDVPRDDRADALANFLDIPEHEVVLMLHIARRRKGGAPEPLVEERAGDKVSFNFTMREWAELVDGLQASIEEAEDPESRAFFERMLQQAMAGVDPGTPESTWRAAIRRARQRRERRERST